MENARLQHFAMNYFASDTLIYVELETAASNFKRYLSAIKINIDLSHIIVSHRCSIVCIIISIY